VRLFQREMRRALRPIRSAQPPAQREVFAGRADPSIGQRIADRFRDRVEASLLRRLIRVIEIELIDELVERRSDRFARATAATCARDWGRAMLRRVLPRLSLDRLRDVIEPQFGHQRQRLVREELPEKVAQPFGRGRPAGDAELDRIPVVAIVGSRSLQGFQLHCQNIGRLGRFQA
jgi:hypothetical protein